MFFFVVVVFRDRFQSQYLSGSVVNHYKQDTTISTTCNRKRKESERNFYRGEDHFMLDAFTENECNIWERKRLLYIWLTLQLIG